MLKINKIVIYRVDLPLVDPFEHSSSGLIDALQEVVVAISLDNGVTGYGEVRGNCFYATGDTPGRVIDVALYLSRMLIGESVASRALLLKKIDKAIVGNAGAKALMDIAIHDAYAKTLGVPVYELLGGASHELLATDTSIAFCSIEESALKARKAIKDGYRLIKTRVGMGFEQDEDRLKSIRKAIDDSPAGGQVALAVDANGAWYPKEAVCILRRWEKFGLSFVEQPVRPSDLEGLRFVRNHTAIPIMADEACHGPEDVLELIKKRAVDFLHFKLIKAGGFARLKMMMAIAEAANVPYMIGQMDEGMLATAAAVHAGAVSRARFFEVQCYNRVATQPFRGLEFKKGNMVVPKTPGLGVEVDLSALQLVHVVT